MALSAAALLGGAVFLGWIVHEWISGEPKAALTVTVNRPIEIARERQVAVGTMPNVLGLDEQTARRALADAGLATTRIATKRQPYVGEKGVVVDQDPAPGAETNQGKFLLTLSVPAQMPTLSGRSLEDARQALGELGAGVVVGTRYQPGASENTVLETHPLPGRALSGRARLIVAESPSSVFLSQLNAIDSNCGTETLNVAGAVRRDALVCEPGTDSPATMEYLLNRRVASFTSVLGLGDRGAPDTPITFTAFVDGRRVLAQTLGFGQARRVRIPVVGALRIRLEASVRAVGSSGQQPEAVFADARFLGGRSAIDALIAESTQ
jgi:PASTA domain-containing protein/NPCBM/NEW2 domain-containing protein